MDRSFELHFNERPFLNHFSYLFITKTTKERSRSQSNFSILCRGNIIPKEVRDKETVSLFLESVDQFERILNDSAFIRLERLTTDEIVGTPQQAGLIEKYFSYAYALTAMTGTSADISRMALVASRPLMLGIFISIKIKSGLYCS